MGVSLTTFTPFDLEANLGRAYNAAMALVPDEGWACFLDHDMMLTTREWYRQLVEVIAFRPDAGLFTAATNRIGATWQRAPEADVDNHDIAYHRRLGQARLARRTLLDVTETHGYGGVLTCLSKDAWRAAGGFVDGMLCVDHQMHFALRRVGRPVFLLESLYVYHWRRAHGDALPAGMPHAVGCLCRGVEKVPTRRVALP
jgi:GT2 family glycosyltransferase